MKNKYDYNDENSINLKLVIALSRTNTSFSRALQNFLTQYGLTVAQFGVLEALYHLGPLQISDLIDKTLSTSGNMTVVIKNLEKEALIQRNINDQDRRAFLISLTEKGRTLIKPVFKAHLSFLSDFFARLDEGEKSTLIKLLRKLNGID